MSYIFADFRSCILNVGGFANKWKLVLFAVVVHCSYLALWESTDWDLIMSLSFLFFSHNIVLSCDVDWLVFLTLVFNWRHSKPLLPLFLTSALSSLRSTSWRSEGHNFSCAVLTVRIDTIRRTIWIELLMMVATSYILLIIDRNLAARLVFPVLISMKFCLIWWSIICHSHIVATRSLITNRSSPRLPSIVVSRLRNIPPLLILIRIVTTITTVQCFFLHHTQTLIKRVFTMSCNIFVDFSFVLDISRF